MPTIRSALPTRRTWLRPSASSADCGVGVGGGVSGRSPSASKGSTQGGSDPDPGPTRQHLARAGSGGLHSVRTAQAGRARDDAHIPIPKVETARRRVVSVVCAERTVSLTPEEITQGTPIGEGDRLLRGPDPILVRAPDSLQRLAELAIESPGCRVLSVGGEQGTLLGLVPGRVPPHRL